MFGLWMAVAGAAPEVEKPPRTHHVAKREVYRVQARDGVQLHTVVMKPRGEGPFPTVMTRLPYRLDLLVATECRRFVRRGYACVWQHVRGREESDGAWRPFFNDERDGQDFVQWVQGQSWSDGRIAWIGASYLAATGWTVAQGDPDGVKLLVSRIFAPPLHRSAFEDGLLRHELATAWMTKMPSSEDDQLGGARTYKRALAHRPRTTMDVASVGHEVPWFREWIRSEVPTDPFWQSPEPLRFENAAESMQVPVFMVGGWSDAFIDAQLDAWSRLSTRDESMLVVGPWAHLGQRPASFRMRGKRGPNSAGGGLLQGPRVMDWMDHHLKGTAPRTEHGGVVTYVVGGDRWERRDAWPPPTTRQRWGLSPGDTRCDGSLLVGEQPLQTPLRWTYDPEDPLPSRGGAGILAGALPLMGGVKPGFVRVRDLCRERSDVWRFVSAPLEAPLHFAGTVRMELKVASSAPDTAFGFRLLERRRGGKEIMLREGFATLALRHGPPRQPYAPGERVWLTPDAQPLEAELQPGSSLVVVITSSSFPAVEAHPNRAGVLAEAVDTQPAEQTVFEATLVMPVVGDEPEEPAERGSPVSTR
ncbi:MAG: CocE/NonD family hydrolase [Myxococcales bacterium]|nr:CocE/NonD family hydrolase [Myxococcales bacterium]